MIVFVEIQVIGRNACGFFDTVYERFIEVDGSHAFDSADEIMEIEPLEMAERCASLVPHGFYERTDEDRDRAEAVAAAVARRRCICARCAKYDGCPNAAPSEDVPGYEGICADCREDRRHAGHTPEVK